VTIVFPAGYFQTTPNPLAINLSRGSLDVDHVDFAIDAGPQGARVASQPSRLRPAPSDVSSSVLVSQTVATLTSAGEPILQTGNGPTMTDILYALLVGFARGQDDGLRELRL
jgi:hypothetical protein